jgi:hypothetical protein
MDYKIKVVIKDKNNEILKVNSNEQNKIISFLKTNLDILRNNVHDNFKFIRFPNDTFLIFVDVMPESLVKIKEHIHKLICNDEKMTISFDGALLEIIQK